VCEDYRSIAMTAAMTAEGASALKGGWLWKVKTERGGMARCAYHSAFNRAAMGLPASRNPPLDI
jgi:hypothetical protein